MLKQKLKKIIYKEKSSSSEFIKYLRKKGATVGEYTYFFNPRNVKIDTKRLDYLKIGSYCKITQGVQFLNHDYSWSVLRKYSNDILPNGGYEIEIGDNVFIGWNALIMGPVKIGSNVIIGANSVVTKNIESNSVYAGNPAKKLCTLEEYLKRKKENILNVAKNEYLHIREIKKENPSIQELGWFCILFLERTEANKEYIKTLPFHGDNINEVIDIFNNTKPYFNSYNEFIDYCIKE